MNSSISKILKKLQVHYPQTQCFLKYQTPFQLVCAVILSAQCTDERVNRTTPLLFKNFPTPEKMARAPIKAIETLIHSTGFYRHKAKNILECSKIIHHTYHGQIPSTLEELVRLPGVGRKTANVILGEIYKKSEGIVVDTHVARLSQRLQLTQSSTAEKIEQDLMGILPQSEWIAFSHRLIQHGRNLCIARKPRCNICFLQSQCPSAFLEKNKSN